VTVNTLQFLSIEDLAHLYKVHPRTARRWAREDGWRRTRTRPLRYSVEDCQRSFDRRQGSRVNVRLLEQRLADVFGPRA
jgi:uncharacterized protein YjcR